MAEASKEIILSARDVIVTLGEKNILDHLDLDVYRGEVLGFVGGSGAGKSVLMRTIIGLIPKRQGKIKVFPHLGDENFGPGEWLKAEGKVAEVPGVW